MTNKLTIFSLLAAVLVMGPFSAIYAEPGGELAPAINTGSYNLHLERTIRFDPIQPGSDPVNGQAAFGLAADGINEDKTDALFEGPSMPFGGTVVSNTRTCFTCHRGPNEQFGLPPGPLSDTIPLTDALFTGIEADAQGDPDAMHNLDQLGLIKYRPNRFNPARPQSDPFRKVFGWRKSQSLLNVGLTHGFLTDGRGRVMFETARGAVFSHTQASDNRFDDLFPLPTANDMEAFMFGLLTDPQLAALRDPNDPAFEDLVEKPFLTVPAVTLAQKLGKVVFIAKCFVCHNTPQVFNNRANVEATGNGDRPVIFPSFAPSVGRTFNIGVSERNKHNLRFTESLSGGNFAPIVVSLVEEDGTVIQHTVTFDIGLASTSGRAGDIGRFKVPQLRGLADNAPYFHDNSADTIEEVVDYFNSPDYNNSMDGKKFPINLTPGQTFLLIEFLKIL